MLNKYRYDIVTIFILLFIVILSYSHLIFMESNVGIGESRSFFTFPIELVRDSLFNFKTLPLWQSQTTSGAPIISNPCFQLFYPIFYVSLFFQNSLVAVRIDFLIHLLIISLSVYFLARVMGARILGAFLGSAALVLSLPTLGKVTNGIVCEIHGLAFTPFTLGLVWLGLQKKNLVYFILGGIVLAIQILSANVYCFIFSSMGVCLIFLHYFILELNSISFKKFKFFIFGFLLFFLIGVGLSAVQLIPMMEFKQLSSRNEISLAFSEFTPAAQPSLTYLKSLFLNYNGPYVTFIFIFFVFASFLFKPKKTVYFLWAFLILFFVASRGPASPVDIYALFYYIIPGLKSNDHPAKFLFMVYISLSILAALGVTQVYSLLKEKIKLSFTSVLLLGVILLFVGMSGYTVFKRFNEYNGQTVVFPNSQERDINSVLKDISRKEGETSFRVYSDNLYVCYSTTSALYEYQLVNFAYYSQKAKWYTPYDYLAFSYPYPPPWSNESLIKLLGVLNTKYIVTYPQSVLAKQKYLKSVYQDNKNIILENPYFLPRVFSPSKNILMIGKDKIQDFGSAETKLITYNPEFDPSKLLLIRGKSDNLKDYLGDSFSHVDAVILTDSFNGEKGVVSQFREKCEKRKIPIIEVSYSVKDYGSFAGAIPDMERSVWTLDKISEQKVKRLLAGLNIKASKLKELEYEFLEYTPNEIKIKVKTNEPNRFVAFSESYFPGWTCSLNGEQTPIFLADSFVKGVFVPAKGESTIVLSYNPLSFKIGLITSFFSLLIVIVILLKKNL